MALTQVRAGGLEDGAYGLIFQSTTSLSEATANMDITLSASSFDYYKFVGVLANVTDAQYIEMKFFDSGGSIVEGASDYHWVGGRFIGSSANVIDSADSHMRLSNTVGSSTNENGISFEMLVGPTNTSSFPVQYLCHSFYHNNGSTPEGFTVQGGYVDETKTFGGVRFFVSSGDLASHSKVTVYGMKT